MPTSSAARAAARIRAERQFRRRSRSGRRRADDRRRRARRARGRARRRARPRSSGASPATSRRRRARSCWPAGRCPADPRARQRRGIGVVWQDLALCENLDVAGNLLLGQETRRLMFSESRFHAAAAALLDSLRIPIRDTTRLVGSLSAGQRQLVARRQGDQPRAAAAGARRAHGIAGRDRGRAGRGADHEPAGAGHDDPAGQLATSTRCSGSPTGSSSCATGGSWPSSIRATPIPTMSPRCCPARRSTPPRAASSRGLHGLAGPPGVGRSVVQPVPDPVRAGRGPGHRDGVHPRRQRRIARLRGLARASPPGRSHAGRGCRSAPREARPGGPRPTSGW